MATAVRSHSPSSRSLSGSSDGEFRCEDDSDYVTDEEGEDELTPLERSIVWTGYAKRTPVIVFNSEAVLKKKNDFKCIGESYHMAYKLGASDCRIIRAILTTHGFIEGHPNTSDFNLVWTGSHLKPYTLRGLNEFQKINHFPRSYELTRKDRLYKNIQRMQQIKGYRHFDIVPQSFVMPTEYQDFCASFLRDKGTWIVKPIASSRGRGVYLINHPDQVPLDDTNVVCKYLGNPILIDGFKFDVRLYVAVMSYDPLRIYLYEEGLVRFATVPYDKSTRNLRQTCMHLTNYSVNKKNKDFVQNNDADVEDYGNKWSLGALLRYLKTKGRDVTALMMKIEDVIIKSIIAVETPIATACKMFMPYRGNCFELYGFDILIDDNLKPWVLEVNLSPSLATDSPLDQKIKSNMICDLLSLSGLICHDPMLRHLQQSRRNQDNAAKMPVRNRKQRPQSAGASLPSPAVNSASSATSDKELSGLTSEEIKIMRRVREEEERRGRWVRIFPSSESWDLYSSFLQFSSTYNLMIHQRLYPDRHSKLIPSQKPTSATYTSAGSRAKGVYNQLTSQQPQQHGKLKFEGETYANAVVRTKQYVRRLESPVRGRRKRKPRRKRRDRQPLIQGVAEQDEEVGQEEEEEEEENDLAAEFNRLEPATNSHPVASKPHVSTTKPQSDLLPLDRIPPAEVYHAFYDTEDNTDKHVAKMKLTVVEMLKKGGHLSKVQARTAFAMYLIRVQDRLMSLNEDMVTSDEDADTLNEQMDLVLRFLKRAATNLQQSFRVIVPSRKLPMSDRRRILAKQLADFVHIYDKETDQLKVKNQVDRIQMRTVDDTPGLDNNKFQIFVNTASESELEDMLTTYTKLHKSASIFLGSSGKSDGGQGKPRLQPTQKLGYALSTSDTMLAKHRDTGGEEPTLDYSSDSKMTSGPKDRHRPHSTKASFAASIAAYSAKLTSGSRPTSAGSVRSAGSRPQSALSSSGNRAQDVYNHKAIDEALQRLTTRQQARLYSAFNSSNRLTVDIGADEQIGLHRSTSWGEYERQKHKSTKKATTSSVIKTPHCTVITAETDLLQRPNTAGHKSHSTYVQYYEQGSGKPPSGAPRSKTMDVVMPVNGNSTKDHITDVTPKTAAGDDVNRNTAIVPASIDVRLSTRPKTTENRLPNSRHNNAENSHESPVILQRARPDNSSTTHAGPMSANATFNSFITDSGPSWQNDLVLAYNQVTGVTPFKYQSASPDSRQHELASEQHKHRQHELAIEQLKHRQQELLASEQQRHRWLMEEQSRALLEQSKAKHLAMIAQAHAETEKTDMTHVAHAPKPPTQPNRPKPPTQPNRRRSGARNLHRLLREGNSGR